ncbi:MAG: MFS transporter [Proteobacteria bacterium]|nr:MFS transporter [Pseudomonadota bacterium]MDA0994770.1 MFS transporter [Pseudomonadota bacterium]
MTIVASTSENLSHDVIDRGPVTAQQLLVVGLCMFFNMLDGFDITAMAVVASSVSSELELTPDKLGWIFSFALAGMMGGAMFLAPVSDIIGRRKLIIMAMILIGVSIVLTASASTLPEFVILRFISGLGAGAMLASQAALAAEYSPDKYKAFSVAAVTSGYPLGAMMTSVIAGYIMPDYGWRGMFWFGGLITLAMVLVAWLMIPESLKYLFERRPDDALERINRILRKLKKDTLSEMPEVIEDKTLVKTGLLSGMRLLLARENRKTTLTLWTAFLLCFSTLYFLMSWIPKLMEDSGFDAAAGRDAFFLFNLGGVIGIYLMGWMSTRWKLTNLIFYLSTASAVGMVVFALAPNELNLLLSLTLLIGILQQGGFTGLYGAAAKAYPTRIRSTGIGWAIGLGRFGAVVGPAVAGYLIAGGLSMSANYFIFAVPMAVGGYIAYRLHIR